MKKVRHISNLLLILIAILCMAAVQSCAPDKPVPKLLVNVNGDVKNIELSMDVIQNQKTFKITSKTDWTITAPGLSGTNGGWYTVSAVGGKVDAEISVAAKTNDTGAERTVVLTVKGKNNGITVTLKQAADGPTVLEVDKTSLSFTVAPTAPEKFNVTAAALGFTITTKDELPAPQEGATAWYTITPMNSDAAEEISVTATANGTGEVRSVTLVVTSPTGKTKEVSIDQAADGPTVLEVDKTSLSFTVAPTAPEKFNVTAAALGFTITTKDELPAPQEGATAWYTITPIKSDAAKEISVTATANGTGEVRSVTLVVASPSGKTKEVKIDQAADGPTVLEVDKTSLSFTVAPTAPEKFNVTAAALGFTITTKDELPAPQEGATAWYTITPIKSDAAEEISVTATANGTGEVRSVTLVVASPSGKTKEVKIDQAADGPMVLEVDKTSLSFPVAPTAPEKFKITAAALGFTITTKDEFPVPQGGATAWYKITPLTSNNNAEVSVTATPNITGKARSVTLVVTSPTGKTKEVSIDQAADGPTVLEVDKTVLSFTVVPTAPEKFNVTAAALGFTITTKDELPAPQEGATAWYTITPMNSDAAEEISVTATANGTGVERSVTLVVTSPTGKTKEVKVRQTNDDADLLVLSTGELTRFAVKEPTPQIFEINTLFNWTVTFEDTTEYGTPPSPTDPKWASANITSGNSGRSTVIVSARSNDSNTSVLRTGKFTITSATGKKQTVAVSQLNTLNSTFATNFLNWCIQKGGVDVDRDGFISTEEALAVGAVKCADQGLGSLKGLENFTNLWNLQCRGNNLNELDLKHNKALGYFDCGRNNLTVLDMSAQSEVFSLLCYENRIHTLHLGSLKKITKLNCKNNNLSTLSLMFAGKLSILNCEYNPNLYQIDIRSTSFDKLKLFTFQHCKGNIQVVTWRGFNIQNKPGDCDWQYTTAVNWSPVS